MNRAIPSPAVLRSLFITLQLAGLAAAGMPHLDGFVAAAGLLGVALLAAGAGFLAREAARLGRAADGPPRPSPAATRLPSGYGLR